MPVWLKSTQGFAKTEAKSKNSYVSGNLTNTLPTKTFFLAILPLEKFCNLQLFHQYHNK